MNSGHQSHLWESVISESSLNLGLVCFIYFHTNGCANGMYSSLFPSKSMVDWNVALHCNQSKRKNTKF